MPTPKTPRKRVYMTGVYMRRYDPPMPVYTGPRWIGVGITNPSYLDTENWIGSPRAVLPGRIVTDSAGIPTHRR